MSDRNVHEPHITAAEQIFDKYAAWVQSTKWSFATDIDLAVAGMISFATDTALSMFHNASGGADNTLYLLLRNVFENAVRIRYLTLDPSNKIKEFHLNDVKNSLIHIGFEANASDTETIARQRVELLQKYSDLKQQVATAQGLEKPQRISLERMCFDIGDAEQYKLYRILSQFEHSTGRGLVNSVVSRANGINNVRIDREFDEIEAKMVWSNVGSLLESIQSSVDILNAQRPRS